MRSLGQVIKTYLGIFFLMVTGVVGIGVVTAGIQSANARNYHADVISEIECSNFNDSVVSACRKQAEEFGGAVIYVIAGGSMLGIFVYLLERLLS